MELPSTYTQDNYQNQNSIVDITYLKEIKGWLRIAETLLSLITFICATVDEFFVRHKGGGWVQFVSITAFILCIILIILHMFRLMNQMPSSVPVVLIELIIVGVFTIFYFISGIVSAVVGNISAAVGACAFFCFASMVVFAVDTFFHFMAWRANNAAGLPPPSATTTSQTPTVTSTTPAPPVSGGATTGGNYATDARSDKAVY